MVTYYRPTGPNTARSFALANWGEGLIVTAWTSHLAYEFNGSLFYQLYESFVAGGFIGVAIDPSGNAWMLGYYGDVVVLAPPDGTLVTGYDLSAISGGSQFAGIAFANGNPYFMSVNGTLYTIVGGTAKQVLNSFTDDDVDEIVGLSSDGAKLYAVAPAGQTLASLTFASATTGTVTRVTTPMLVPANTAASVSGVAVVGWNDAALVSGASALAISPVGAYTAAIANGANAVMLLTGTDPNWVLASSVAGQGAPIDLAWASSGEQVIVTDTVNSDVSIYNLIGDALMFSANIATTGANQVGATPDGLTALVTRTTQNAIRVLTNTANTWSLHSDIAVANSPGPIVVLSDTEAVAGYVPLSGVGGLVWLSLAGGAWGIEATVSGLSFPVSGVAVDTSGLVYAVGTAGASGHLAAVTKTGIVAQTTWAGRGDAILWQQGQIAVIDSSS